MCFFLLVARHRMQALSALAYSVGSGFRAFASLKTALFIQTSTYTDQTYGRSQINGRYFFKNKACHFCDTLCCIFIATVVLLLDFAQYDLDLPLHWWNGHHPIGW